MSDKSSHKVISYGLRSMGIILFIVILAHLDLEELSHTFASIEPGLLLLVIPLCAPLFLLRSLRWKILVGPTPKPVSWLLTLRIYLAANFIGAVTPGHLGEFVKVWHLKKYGAMSKSRGMASVLADRLLDLWVLFSLGFLGVYWMRLLDRFSTAALVVACLLWASPLLILHKGLVAWGVKTLFRISFLKRFFKETDRMREDFLQGILALANKRLILPVLFTLLGYVLYFLQCEILADALHVATQSGEPIEAWHLGMILSIITFITLLPISPAGVGTREAAMIFLFGLQGISKEQAVAFSLLLFLVFFVFMGLVGYAFWLFLPQPKNLETELLEPDDQGGERVTP